MAADGKIVIDVILDDGRVVKGVADINKQIDGINKSAKGASTGVKDMVTALGLVGLAQKGIQLVTSALDGAIKRFDTINGFPSVMERMGFSSEAAQKSISKLSDGIQGLPTTLDGIVSSTQNIAVLTGDLDTATDTALSLNNAFLASGTSAADAERGLVQYVQMLSKGSVDMQSWRTLQETMGYAVNKTAEAFGFAGESAQNDLYAALKDGDIKFKDFNAKIIELNGGVNGFADIAKNSSAGISTSFGNLKNAIVVGVANMIFSFDRLTKEVTGKTIAENLDSLKIVVRNVFAAINGVIESAAPIVKVFASAISATIPVVQTLTPAIIGLTAAFAAYTVITKATSAINAAKVAIAAAEATTQALTIATKARIASQITMTTVDRAGTAVTIASTSAITLKTLAIGVMTKTIKLSTVAQIAATAATKAFGAAISFLSGPVGWVIAGIGLLVTGVIALVKWFNRTTEEGAKLAQQNEALAESTKALSTSVEESAAAYQKNQSNIETNAQAYTELVAEIETLAAKEKKTAEEKKLLNSYIEELNRNVDGLNLVYGEQTNALSATSEQILNRINLMKEEQKQHASQERLTEIIKEQIEIGKQQEEVNALIEKNNKLYEDGKITKSEYKEESEKLQVQEAELSAAHTAAGEERVRVENEIIEANAAVAAAAEENIGRQLKMYDELSESARKTVDDMKSTWEDYASSATDMFDKLSDKSKVSVAEMQKNLEENQRVITDWADNIAKLAERGVDEGLLNKLREAGPESAGHVNALVKASDAELQKLSETFAKGGEVATEALRTSLGPENAAIFNEVSHLVIGIEKTLAASIESADWTALGMDIAKGSAGGIEKGTPEAENAAKEMAKATEDAARKQLDTHSPSKVFVDIGKDTADGLALGIKKGIQAVLKSITTLMKNITKPFDNISATFEKVGNEAMAGMVRGLKAGEKQVIATARSIANSAAQTVRQALDIHSPSRVMKKIGEFTGEGMAIGIANTKSLNEKAVTDVTKVITNAAKANAAEVAKIADKAEDERTKIQQSYAKKRANLKKADSKKIAELEKEMHAKLAEINKKAWSEMEKKEGEANKKKLEAVKKYIDDLKKYNQLSLIEEAQYWRASYKQFANGSAENVELRRQYQDNVKRINDAITSTNNEYLGKAQKINDDLIKSEQDLNKKYNDTLENRYQTILKTFGLFDEVKKREAVTSEVLAKNLSDQVLALNDWRNQLTQLERRRVSKTLLDELRQMGPAATEELRALNSMTDTELKAYQSMYQEKSRIAREQAVKEMEPLKKETQLQISEMREAANKELQTLNTEWQQAIKDVVGGTETQLKTLHQVGKNAGQGLIDGMKSMDGALRKQAENMAKSIKKTIESSLQIKSPSRWMRDYVVGNLAAGFDVGVDRQKSFLTNASEKIGDFIKPSIINPLRGAKVNLDLDKPSPMINNYSTVNNNTFGSDGESDMHIETSDVILHGEKIGEIMYKIVSGKQYRGANVAAMVKGVPL
ncbi:tape measure protein [Metasolibacillus sp.]|uniref:tape measure protein n=1 Tax=Metasolibacillus sp. TaxID=2703680 RepID=UPI0025D34899|nr:tape measure protein [Metasolibacillus sp.]MCT6925317.1 tape measure protein [Metasolibacillus sp.]MCT6941453.1 tape measure protein [Metasolibacillus sp.]